MRKPSWRRLSGKAQNQFVYLKKKEGKSYDYRDVAVRFTRNLPTDLTGLADVITKLKDVCSKETLLTLLPFVENQKVELEKYYFEKDVLVLFLKVTFHQFKIRLLYNKQAFILSGRVIIPTIFYHFKNKINFHLTQKCCHELLEASGFVAVL